VETENIVTQGYGQVDLTSCDLEPIHHIGAIQPVGFLVATSLDWMISHVSENATDFLGGSVQTLLGAPLSDVFGKEAVHDLRNVLIMLRDSEVSVLIKRFLASTFDQL